MVNREPTVTKGTLNVLRSHLDNPEQYTDLELSDAANFVVSAGVATGELLGAIRFSPLNTPLFAEFFAGTMLPEFINSGSIDPKAIRVAVDKMVEDPEANISLKAKPGEKNPELAGIQGLVDEAIRLAKEESSV